MLSSPAAREIQGAPLRCWYSEDWHALRIRLLVDWGALRSEHEFSAHGEEQPLQVFRNLLDAADIPSLKHVHLVEGGKWYGLHIGQMLSPTRESDPRHMPPNFYYDQQDLLVLFRHRQHGQPHRRGRRANGDVHLVIAIGSGQQVLAQIGLALVVFFNDNDLAARHLHGSAGGMVQPHHQAGLGLFAIGFEGAGLAVDVGDADLARGLGRQGVGAQRDQRIELAGLGHLLQRQRYFECAGHGDEEHVLILDAQVLELCQAGRAQTVTDVFIEAGLHNADEQLFAIHALVFFGQMALVCTKHSCPL